MTFKEKFQKKLQDNILRIKIWHLFKEYIQEQEIKEMDIFDLKSGLVGGLYVFGLKNKLTGAFFLSGGWDFLLGKSVNDPNPIILINDLKQDIVNTRILIYSKLP